MMRRFLVLLAAVLAPGYSQPAPPAGLIPNAELPAVLTRSVQLVESTSAAVPGLVQAAAPVHGNIRTALTKIETGVARHPGLLYDFLAGLRSYLVLSDSIPKPSPFPDEARRQFSELRETVDRLQTHFRVSLDEVQLQARNPDRDALIRYADANTRLAKPAPGEKRIVFMGDSITDFWRLNEYYPGRDFINRGISGQVTGQMLGRMKADVIDLQPAAMLVLAGTNDVARGTPLAIIENNLVMMADLAEVYKIKPLFASVLPVSDYHKDVNPRYEYTKERPPASLLELNRWIQAFCAQRHYAYVDYFSQLVDPSGQIKADLADDGLHPNAAGYRLMAPVALAALESHILKPEPAVITSKKRAPKPPVEPKPVDPKPVVARPAPVKPVEPKVVTETKPVETKPAPTRRVEAKPAETKPVATKPMEAAAVATKPVETKPQPDAKKEAASGAAATKKKESFWKRTYPTTPPKPAE